jgi:hypothetical protein
MTKRELVMVDWLDIASHSTWMKVPDARAYKPIRCRDVGWILHRDQQKLILFRSRNSDGDIGDITVMPIGCVVKITPLEPAATKKTPDAKEQKPC